jgi:hypothetical protein
VFQPVGLIGAAAFLADLRPAPPPAAISSMLGLPRRVMPLPMPLPRRAGSTNTSCFPV